jgi:hypothetical protein
VILILEISKKIKSPHPLPTKENIKVRGNPSVMIGDPIPEIGVVSPEKT